MIRACISFTIIALFLSLEARADERLDRIRALYEKAVGMERDPMGSERSHTATMNTILPAIGLQTTTIRFLYESRQINARTDPYLLERRLIKTTVRYNIAASVHYTIEYLYDDQEQPVFFFWQEKSMQPESDEKRIYFHNGKIFMTNMRYHDSGGAFVRYIRTGGFSRNEKKQGNSAFMKAKQYLRHFRFLVELEHIK